jgi:hypothetical protein
VDKNPSELDAMRVREGGVKNDEEDLCDGVRIWVIQACRHKYRNEKHYGSSRGEKT